MLSKVLKESRRCFCVIIDRRTKGDIRMACKWYSLCPLKEWEKEGRIDGRWRREYCESESKTATL